MTKPIGAIVLAAGFSSRFGSSKLLAGLSSGKTVFQQTVERIAEVFPERLVVTRPEMVAALQELALGTSILSFEHADQGMGATLAFAAQQIGDWDACVVCLGDMPFIETSTYRRIAELVTADSIVTPIFDSKMGNPVAFGKNLYTHLEALTGDNGGRRLTSMYPQAVRELQVSDPGILQDIDTLEELALYQDS
ncbi:MAG: molybdenum cofactor cytidylyltransferase [Kiritimatiellia bacterium]|jgi:molybdenum cofactor cytidylyltransferase